MRTKKVAKKSVRTLISLPEELLHQIKSHTRDRDITVSQYFRGLVRKDFSQEEQKAA